MVMAGLNVARMVRFVPPPARGVTLIAEDGKSRYVDRYDQKSKRVGSIMFAAISSKGGKLG